MQRDIALEYHPDWHDFFSSYTLSSEALMQATHVIKDILDRSRRSQHESHTRIMLRQIARNEYEVTAACPELAAFGSRKSDLMFHHSTSPRRTQFAPCCCQLCPKFTHSLPPVSQPARTLCDVVTALKESLGAATTIQVSEFEVPKGAMCPHNVPTHPLCLSRPMRSLAVTPPPLTRLRVVHRAPARPDAQSTSIGI